MGSKLKNFAVTAFLIFALGFCFEQQAHAYADPGSSLLVFQSMSAVVTGAIFYFRRRIARLFRKPTIQSPEAPEKSH
jgi:hypothetical protein